MQGIYVSAGWGQRKWKIGNINCVICCIFENNLSLDTSEETWINLDFETVLHCRGRVNVDCRQSSKWGHVYQEQMGICGSPTFFWEIWQNVFKYLHIHIRGRWRWTLYSSHLCLLAFILKGLMKRFLLAVVDSFVDCKATDTFKKGHLCINLIPNVWKTNICCWSWPKYSKKNENKCCNFIPSACSRSDVSCSVSSRKASRRCMWRQSTARWRWPVCSCRGRPRLMLPGRWGFYIFLLIYQKQLTLLQNVLERQA